MTVSRIGLLAATSLGLFALGACAAGPRPASVSGPTAAACEGQSYLEVRNALDGPVEVYAYPSGAGGSPRFLGTVAPGTERLAVFEPLGAVYAERAGRRVSGRRGAVRPVSFAYVCERP